MLLQDTIAAICTPPGESGIAVIRISGPDAYAITQKLFSKNVFLYKSHTAHVGKFKDADGYIIDQVLVLVFHKKRSYTGESTIEIMCHGGTLISQKILQAILANGARAAQGGEFTFRAFKNGRIDLAQAEAVQSLIHAQNEHALKAANAQLQGSVTVHVERLQHALTHACAIVEAAVDYPEEGLEATSQQELHNYLDLAKSKIHHLIKNFHNGKRLVEGFKIAIMGAPNVGKSSLLNALLEKERAIVTEIAGTTRDLVQDIIHLKGISVEIIDTAGVRRTEEVIEKEGIARSQKAGQEADLVLLIFDATKKSHTDEEKALIAQFPHAMHIYNKKDLLNDLEKDKFYISAKTQDGIETCKEEIYQRLTDQGVSESSEILITKERHYAHLNTALTHIKAVSENLQKGVDAELLAVDLRASLIELASIIGTNITEDVLEAIFSKFCVGK